MTAWHGGRACVAALTFDVDAESAILSKGARYAAHAMAMTHQAFGPRVGVPRILRLLADYDLEATFFVPGLTADRYPGLIATILEAGHEVAHHSYAHRHAPHMAPGEERRDFERALGVLRAQGAEVVGHRAAMWEASWETSRLVAEAGLAYDSSLMDDDKPYRLDTGSGSIIEIPPHWSLDDWEQYAFLPEPVIGAVIENPLNVAAMWTHELDSVTRHNRFFGLTCHPFLSGRAGRIEAMRLLIEHALGRGDVEFLAMREISARAAADASIDRRTLAPVVVEGGLYPPDDADGR